MIGVIVCEGCGAKIRPRHNRCPRCGMKFAAAAAPRVDLNRFVTPAIAALVVAAGLAAYGMWRGADPGVESAPPVPSAARAPSVPSPPQAAQPEEPAPVERGEGQVAFIEPARAGNLAYRNGDFQGALAAYEEAIKKNPADAESWSNLGQVLIREDRVSEAIPAFERAIELNTNRWAYHFNLARAHGLLGRWDLAVLEYREAQRLLPDDYAVTFNLGLALKRTGDLQGAAVQLASAAVLNPTDASFHFALARVYDELGRKEEALAAYRQTLALAPEVVEAPAIRERIDALLK